ncbi:hypothetical protein BGZ83_008541 [Gryganskiella cystojenkinii]|nr:hypothetical protein BGZ83_008541 [Gryganskiella cystojenkinii]
MQHQPNFSSGLFPPSSAANNSCGSGGPNFIYQPSVHPFQVDQLTTSFDDLDMAIAPRVKLEFPVETYLHPSPVPTVGSDSPEVFHPHMEEALPSQAVFSCSPSTSASSESDSSPKFAHSFDDPTSSSVYMGPFRPPLRGQSVSFFETPMSAFDNGDEYPEYAWSRHGSTGSLFPMGHQHYHSDDFHPEYLMSAVEGAHHNHHQHQQQHHQHLQPQHQSKESVPMIPTSSSTSILSTASTSSSSSSNSQSTTPSAKKVRTRRASVCTDTQGPIFQCRFGDCHRPFRRQEHLKRHVRSVHTLEKPFECPVNSCTRRFSRSDNLNQHIRIHRHDNAEQGATPATAPPITFAYHQPQYRQP